MGFLQCTCPGKKKGTNLNAHLNVVTAASFQQLVYYQSYRTDTEE